MKSKITLIMMLMALKILPSQAQIQENRIYSWGYNISGQLGHSYNTFKNYPVQASSDTNWIYISKSFFHSMAINSKGELYGWGNNLYGQLGDSTNTSRSYIKRVGNQSNWVAVSTGENFTVALNDQGEIYAWGGNLWGQLGNGSNKDVPYPVQVGTSSNWTRIACGNTHVLAINSNGEIYVWGYNSGGQLGTGNSSNQKSPVKMGNATNWKEIYASGQHSLAINTNGELYGWGANSYGQLGDSIWTQRYSPKRIGTASNWVTASTMNSHCLAINSNGELYSWGANAYGQLGNDTVYSRQPNFQKVGNAQDWVAVSTGYLHSFAINKKNELWAWGNNNSGYLGDSTNKQRWTPVKIAGNISWKLISSGVEHGIAITTDGKLYTWGSNSNGQLGLGLEISVYQPVELPGASNWEMVSTGNSSSFAINQDGEMFAWGRNGGILGTGNISDYIKPVQIGKGIKWKFVQTGHSGNPHTLAINEKNELYAWGSNANGQLGIGNFTMPIVPTKVGQKNNWKTAAVGGFHSLAINNSGELYAWGNNNNFQIGDSTVTNPTSPVRIGTDTNWVKVSAGLYYSLALNDAGEIYAWGSNSNGQIGNNSSAKYQKFPQKIGNSSNWKHIEAGWDFAIALNEEGELFAWGNNSFGQLGLGYTSAKEMTPQQIGNLKNWTADIDLGAQFGAAINNKGQLFTWGSSSRGQLGIDTLLQSLTPVMVGNDSTWKCITTGFYHTLGIKSVSKGKFELPNQISECQADSLYLNDIKWAFENPYGNKMDISVVSTDQNMINNSNLFLDSNSSHVPEGKQTLGLLNISKINGSGNVNLIFTASDTLNKIYITDTLHIEVRPTIFGDTTSISGCDLYKWNDSTYNKSGFYLKRFASSLGCDSVISLDLTIYRSVYDTTIQNSCSDYSWEGEKYSKSGLYSKVYQTQMGCDSILYLDLNIINVDISTSVSEGTITANATESQFQWLDCSNNYAIIDGQTNNVFTAIDNGEYSVEVTKENCVDTSSCVTITGLDNYKFTTGAFKVFPNPSTGQIFITFEKTQKQIGVQILNQLGQVVYENTFENGNEFHLDTKLSNGLYYLNIIHNNYNSSNIIRINN